MNDNHNYLHSASELKNTVNWKKWHLVKLCGKNKLILGCYHQSRFTISCRKGGKLAACSADTMLLWPLFISCFRTAKADWSCRLFCLCLLMRENSLWSVSSLRRNFRFSLSMLLLFRSIPTAKEILSSLKIETCEC